jgi:glycosyltransferase involved in cell wall biosynthesis
MGSSRRVIIFAGAVFDSPIWTNRQHVATRLAERGWNVLYVEPRLFWPRMLLGGYPGTTSSLRWFARVHIPQRVGRNMWVISQLNAIPWGREVSWISWVNHSINYWAVRFYARRLGFFKDGPPAILLYDTEAAQYLSSFSESRVVYDCVDDHRVQAGVDRNPDRVEREERMIARRADVVSVTTKPLFERFSQLNANTRLVPNAADVHAFRAKPAFIPDDIASIPHPRIGVIGTIDPYKVDLSLVERIARRHSDWHVVLIGPVTRIGKSGDETGMFSLPNVHVLGVKSREEVPAYVHALDVAVIPYVKSEYNRSSFPLKFWEYMASGVPVVSSGLPALRQYSYLAPVAESVDEYIEHIESILGSSAEEGVAIASKDARIAEAENHDYSGRVDGIEGLLVQ